MFKRFRKLAAVAVVVVAAGLGPTRSASAGIAPVNSYGLDTLIDGGANENGVIIGDKRYYNFTFSSSGSMQLDADDIEMVFNVEGTRHFLDILLDLHAAPGERSDVVIEYDLQVLNPLATITSVGLMFDGGPLDSGGNGRSAASVIESVSTLDFSDLAPGGEDQDTEIISVFNDGEGNLNDFLQTSLEIHPTRGLHFTKDILVSSRLGSMPVAISMVQNSVNQTVIPLPAAVWAAMPVLGAIFAGKKLRRLTGRN